MHGAPRMLALAAFGVAIFGATASTAGAPATIVAPVATVFASPNGISQVRLDLQPAAKGPSRVSLDNGIKGGQATLVEQALHFQPEVQWFGEDYVGIVVWRTPSERTMTIYDLMRRRASAAIPGVLAVDRNRMVAANVDGERLRLVDVFGLPEGGRYHGGNSIALDANFPAGRPLQSVIKVAEFTPAGDFLMRYEVGEKVLMGVRVSGAQIRFDSD